MKLKKIDSPNGKESLTFRRAARAAKDGYNGFLYLHVWPTGFQELIFISHESALNYFNRRNTGK